ncbi:MAG: phosphodiesterase, partial [Reyranellales bacterium]
MTLIAQITDMHIRPSGKMAYGVVDTEAMLRAAVSSILAESRRPDLVIATGDLTDCGLVEEYELLRDILKPLPMPVYLIPGNHDRRENLRLVFGGEGYLPMNGEFLHYTVEDHELRLIGLDTVVPGKGHGELDAARLDWLRARLDEQPDRPTLIFMHHPPFPTGLQHMDSINCRDEGGMAEILKGRGNVERVVC